MRPLLRSIGAAILVVAALLLAGCNVTPPPEPTTSFTDEELMAAFRELICVSDGPNAVMGWSGGGCDLRIEIQPEQDARAVKLQVWRVASALRMTEHGPVEWYDSRSRFREPFVVTFKERTALQEAQHDADFYREALATAEAKLKKLQEVKP